MAKVPRLNRTILEQRVDTSAIGRADDLTQAAGALVDQQVGMFQEKQDLAERTEIARRNTDFQNKAFDIIQENRAQFSANPEAGIDALDVSLRDLGKTFEGDLSPRNAQAFSAAQERSIGRIGLDQRQWALKQTTKNIESNIKATRSNILQSARAAGDAGDFSRIGMLSEDINDLMAQATATGGISLSPDFQEELKQGVVENFTDGMIFNNPEKFLEEANQGTFDDIMQPEDLQDKKKEAQDFMETKNEQAKFDRSLSFLKNNTVVADDVAKGKISFNELDDLVAAGDISPEMAEAKRKEILGGKVKVVTDPIVYGNVKAKAQRLVEKGLFDRRDIKGVTEGGLAESIKLQQEIADLQAEGKLKASDGNALTKMLQIGISNTVALDGLEDFTQVNHYEDALSTFEDAGLEGTELMNAMRAYTLEADSAGVDELNNQLAEQTGILSGAADLIGAGKSEERKSLRKQIEEKAKVVLQDVRRSIAVQKNPALAGFQGDLPNNIIENGLKKKIAPGGDAPADGQVSSNTMVMTDGNGNRALVEVDANGNPVKVIREID